MSRKLSGKQKDFCKYYLTNFNATESAKKAGYSERTAYAIGHNQLKKVEIKKYLRELSKPRLDELKLDRDEIIITLTKIARGQVQDYEIRYDKSGAIKLKIVKDLVSNRLKALELLCVIMGIFDYSPSNTDFRVTINYVPKQK